MNNIENDGIQLFEDQKIRVAWDEQQEELKKKGQMSCLQIVSN